MQMQYILFGASFLEDPAGMRASIIITVVDPFVSKQSISDACIF
jgi:hypothetical protein